MVTRAAPKRGLLGSGSVVAANLALEFGSQFVRAVVLARLLGATEFGLVASIATFLAVVEMSTTFGPGRYLVYVHHDEETRALAAVHAITLVRGAILAGIVLLLAAPIASVLGQPQHITSFAIVAMVPLLRGFTHWGTVQMNRHGNFWRFAFAEGSAALAGLLAAVCAALILRDHRAILWGLAAQIVWVVLATHVLSPYPYRVSFERTQIRAAMRFGLPLMVNGMALAAASQLDRLIVGAWLSVAALGIYGLAITLILQPVTLILRLSQTVMQPRLSTAWHADPSGRYHRLLGLMAAAVGVFGFVAATCAVCLGGPVFSFIFGEKFQISDQAFAALAFVALLRLARGSLGLSMLASGRTSDLMYSNLAGCFGLVTTFTALLLYPAIESALVGQLVAELFSFCVASARLERGTGRPMLRAVLAAAGVPALLAIWVLLVNPNLELRIAAVTTGLAAALILARSLYRRSEMLTAPPVP
jgi:O-antigen/teichoic acid export membrane protein